MRPAFSVIFLTTLIGAGQGLFLALLLAEAGAGYGLPAPAPGAGFYVHGSALALVLLGAGLAASFFHLGHPERAWRAAAMWRTSWLSREVIALPATMALIALYGGLHQAAPASGLTLAAGAAAALAVLALFVCTGMIYACIKFLQEWATPLTVVNYTLLGCASGFTLASAWAGYTAPALAAFYAHWALGLLALGLVTRTAALVRNARLRPRSCLQTAIGVRHTRIAQKAQGFMGGSFNTREFFHRAAPAVFRGARWAFLVGVFPLPALLLLAGSAGPQPAWLAAAFAVQYLGLLAERWFFFAQSGHPQNLYYQTVG